MKIIITLLLSASLLLGGCAGLTTTGTQVDNFICHPTAEQQATATAMLAALDAAQAAGAIFFPIVGIFKASAVLTTIQAGGCFLVTELQEAFKAVDAANAAKAQAKGPKFAADAARPEYASLRKFIK